MNHVSVLLSVSFSNYFGCFYGHLAKRKQCKTSPRSWRLDTLFILGSNMEVSFTKCDALRDLVSFVHFKEREKHPWRSVNFSKVAGFSMCDFSRFLNCTNDTKLRNAPQVSFHENSIIL